MAYALYSYAQSPLRGKEPYDNNTNGGIKGYKKVPASIVGYQLKKFTQIHG